MRMDRNSNQKFCQKMATFWILTERGKIERFRRARSSSRERERVDGETQKGKATEERPRSSPSLTSKAIFAKRLVAKVQSNRESRCRTRS